MDTFLLYGAYGYTGRIIAAMAAQYGLKPVLAGRREAPLREMAGELRLPFTVVDLEDREALDLALEEHGLVLHAAGPFSRTARPMALACMRTGKHYVDITGELAVFEMLKGFDTMARHAGIMLLPGAGFDVVPTDCTALLLKQAMPGAVELKLAFSSLGGGMSHGTATTMLAGLGEKGAVRQDGKIVPVPMGHKGRWVDFGGKKLFVMSIPWGDVSTAHHTTGIPNIETYTGLPPSLYRLLKWQGLFNWALRSDFVRRRLQGRIDRQPAGPAEDARKKACSLVWGEVTGQDGRKASVHLKGPDGYTLTAHASLLIVRKILQGQFRPGYGTPAGVYGADLILEVPGVERSPVRFEPG